MEKLLELFGMSKAKPVKTPFAPHFAALTLRAATASALTQHLLTGWINYLFSVVTIEPG